MLARRSFALTAAICLALYVGIPISAYFGGKYHYHDLTLIGDFLANTAYGRSFFRISDSGVSHFTIHFTPTLVALVPFYRLFSGQWVILVLGAFALTAGLFLADAIFLAFLEKLPPSPWKKAAPMLLLVVLGLDRFSKNVLLSGHFEIFYVPLALLLFLGFLRRWPLGVLLGIELLALGVRQDAALYLTFQSVGLGWLAPTEKRSFDRRAWALAAFAFGYGAIWIGWLLPHFGAVNHAARFWGHYGRTWGEVVWGALTSPRQVFDDLIHSGFLSLNLTFFLLPLLRPSLFVVMNVPGVLLYLSDAGDKKYLWYYHAAFLLPGLYLATAAGMARLLSWRGASPSPWLRRGLGLWLAITVPISLLTFKDTNDGFKFWPVSSAPTQAYRSALSAALDQCPGALKVAADYQASVFTPNRYQKYLYGHWEGADLVVIPPALMPPHLRYATALEWRAAVEKDPGFERLSVGPGAAVFAKRDLHCSSR